MPGFRIFLWLCAAAALLLGTTSARADGEKDAANPDKRLGYFVGAWDVAVTYQLPDGKEYQGKAACVTKRVLNGKFIQQEYQSRMNNQPLSVWQILGYDTVKKRFVEIHLNAHGENAHTMTTDGTFSDDGKVLTLRGDVMDSSTGKPVKLRAVTTIKDNDHYRLEWFYTGAGGKEERKVVLSHTRKAGAQR
jgi:hypothetical protein